MNKKSVSLVILFTVFCLLPASSVYAMGAAPPPLTQEVEVAPTASDEALAKVQINNLKNISISSQSIGEGYAKFMRDVYSGKKYLYEFNGLAIKQLMADLLDKNQDWKYRYSIIDSINPDNPPRAFDAFKIVFADKSERVELRRIAIGNIASTSYTQPWTTANHTGGVVGSDGWIRQGPYDLPFTYNDAPESKNVRSITGYAPPADVVINSWMVNSDNPYALAYGANANGDFNVRLADNSLIKTLQFDTSTTAGEHSIAWDGKDNAGNIVADGDYIYYIYAGPNIVKKSGDVKVRRSAEITAASVSENYLSPNGDGVKDNVTVNYTLSELAAVNVEVANKDGAVVKSFSSSGNVGANTTAWDGTNNSGAIVEDGEYTARINATHANGAKRIKEIKIVVDRNSLTAPTDLCDPA
jgi:flagellar hook assembly protein FlgD